MIAHDTWPTTDTESLELIEQCGSLKTRLTEYARTNLRGVIEWMAASRDSRPMSEYDADPHTRAFANQPSKR